METNVSSHFKIFRRMKKFVLKKLIIAIDVALFVAVTLCTLTKHDFSLPFQLTINPIVLCVIVTGITLGLLYFLVLQKREAAPNQNIEITNVSLIILTTIVFYALCPMPPIAKLTMLTLNIGILVVIHWMSFDKKPEWFTVEDVDNVPIRR